MIRRDEPGRNGTRRETMMGRHHCQLPGISRCQRHGGTGQARRGIKTRRGRTLAEAMNGTLEGWVDGWMGEQVNVRQVCMPPYSVL
jgi:hypothetical protein